LRFGGLAGIRDEASIHAAITRPYTGYYRKIEEKAAALVQSVAANHGFIDGNKRTAFILLILLLNRSGYRLVPVGREKTGDALEQVIVDLVEHNIDQSQLIEWFKLRVRTRP
jgi:death on curing protein